jgi:hypothetical protein
MASRAIKPKRGAGGGGQPPPTWQSIEERAPSILREEGPTFPRYVAVFGLALVTLGGAALLFRAFQKDYLIAPGLGIFLMSIGILGLIYHAYNEKDFQFRRLYGALGAGLVGMGAVMRLFPTENNILGLQFLPWGVVGLFLGLGFVLAFVRNETDLHFKTLALNLLGICALVNVALGAYISFVVGEAFLSQAIFHLIFGLLYAVGYVAMEGTNTRRGLWAGRGIGIVGLALFLVALGRSILPELSLRMGWITMEQRPRAFFLPSGLVLMYIGAEYLIAYLTICSDNKLVVLTRRELGAFFHSPIAYIVMIGMALIGGLQFWIFVGQLMSAGEAGRGMPEPIFEPYVVSFLALIPLIFLVPAITMRMVSEEKRTGSLEMLLTAPVNEWQVVLSKFLAGLRVFMLCWYLWGVFFIALRVEGGEPFDYRPIITFLIALICMGAAFVSIGLFFSSLTNHQIMAAVLTFVCMFVWTLLFFLPRFLGDVPWLTQLVGYVAYIDFWWSGARGVITPRLCVLYLSVAAFWLYLSIKVLEARKWS